jgi:S1-C subfamily serine protease
MNFAPRIAALLLLAALAAPGGFCAARAESTEEPVKMAPFRVEDSSLNFGLGLSTWLGRNGARHVMITHVDHGSLAEKAGLLPADRLLSIDGNSLANCDAAGLMKLFNRTATPGDTMSWSLTIERGPSGKPITVKLQAKAGRVGLDSSPGGPLVIAELAPVAPAARHVPDPSRR